MSDYQKLCPNCIHFLKIWGMNDCKLVNWSINPMGGNKEVNQWRSSNVAPSTRIYDDANNCPGFKLWFEDKI
mgnify:FL=1